MAAGIYSIGEFSRIAQLSVKSLRFYDEVGILKPREVSLSGYRYYDAAQLPAVRLIQRLKTLDFTLEEIRAILEGRADLRAELDRQRSLLDARAASYAEAAHRAQAWAAALATLGEEAATHMKQYEVKVEPAQPVTVMAIRKVGPVREIGECIREVIQYLTRSGQHPTGPAVVMYYDQEFDPERISFSAGWPVLQALAPGETPAGRVEVISLPAGRVAWVKHVGPYEELGDAYRALMDHVKSNGLTMAGPPREWYLNDPRSTPAAQLATKVEFPVA